VSLVLTTLNEREALPALLEDILRLDPRPPEFIVVDAGSEDGTLAQLQAVSDRLTAAGIDTRVLVAPGVNIARGRNLAVAEATGEIIAVTDAGCRLPPQWYGAMTSHIASGAADFVGGFFLPVARTRFQRILAALTTRPTPGRDFKPSSRSVAFSRDLWKRVGGYPEDLRYAEDSVFNEQCLRAGARYLVEASAPVQWEVRRSLRDALRQYYNYASGDAWAGRLSTSMGINQLAFWTAIGSFALGQPIIGLLVLGFYPAVLVLRRRSVAPRDYPQAWFLSLAIAWARFAGAVKGAVARVTSGRRS